MEGTMSLASSIAKKRRLATEIQKEAQLAKRMEEAKKLYFK
jgi:hypothetical protein